MLGHIYRDIHEYVRMHIFYPAFQCMAIWMHTSTYKATCMWPNIDIHVHIRQHISRHVFECMLAYIFAYMVL